MALRINYFWGGERVKLHKFHLINLLCYKEYISPTEEMEWNSRLMRDIFMVSGRSQISSQTSIFQHWKLTVNYCDNVTKVTSLKSSCGNKRKCHMQEYLTHCAHHLISPRKTVLLNESTLQFLCWFLFPPTFPMSAL